MLQQLNRCIDLVQPIGFLFLFSMAEGNVKEAKPAEEIGWWLGAIVHLCHTPIRMFTGTDCSAMVTGILWPMGYLTLMVLSFMHLPEKSCRNIILQPCR